MSHTIQLLSQDTIDKIAAGEVIERPSSIVKELVENSIDAGANAITIEIRDGGISLIRITDNGEGIDKDMVRTAFLRHATSKIRSVEDLLKVGSLGFRGEALASICAVCQVELITKTSGSLTGIRYQIEGGREKGMEEIGAPEGSTFLVRNIFYNTPARKKFLKSPATEAGYVSDLVEHLALSHPEISFKFIVSGQTRLHTSGNNNLKDIVYSIYGRDIAANLIQVDREESGIHLKGFLGKPSISRGNRNFENYYVNQRYVKSTVIAKAIEEGYKNFLMQHRYPFTVLSVSMDGSLLDINVHPAKMDIRFADNTAVYQLVYDAVRGALTHRDLIPKVSALNEQEQREQTKEAENEKLKENARAPEPFEQLRKDLQVQAKNVSPYSQQYPDRVREHSVYSRGQQENWTVPSLCPAASSGAFKAVKSWGKQQSEWKKEQERKARQALKNVLQAGEAAGTDKTNFVPSSPDAAADTDGGDHSSQARPDGNLPSSEEIDHLFAIRAENRDEHDASDPEEAPAGRPAVPLDPEGRPVVRGQQMEMFDDRLLSKKNVPEHRLIGQIFDTYWIVEFRDSMYIIDQHAAHEKVMYERLCRRLENKEQTSQQVSPPLVVTLSLQEENLLKKYLPYFEQIGYTIESFGGHDYAITAVPDNLYGITDMELFTQMLDSLSDYSGKPTADIVNQRLASMACKAAVKGNHRLSTAEANALISELLELENPYNCPHGRPTIIQMTKYELEKKFKRIV